MFSFRKDNVSTQIQWAAQWSSSILQTENTNKDVNMRLANEDQNQVSTG